MDEPVLMRRTTMLNERNIFVRHHERMMNLLTLYRE
jgi:hypothetical protein